MYVSVNKHFIILKIALVFYIGFARERDKRRFLISNVPVGNTILCCGQRVHCELQLSRPVLTLWCQKSTTVDMQCTGKMLEVT
jgi:hypothetical protein